MTVEKRQRIIIVGFVIYSISMFVPFETQTVDPFHWLGISGENNTPFTTLHGYGIAFWSLIFGVMAACAFVSGDPNSMYWLLFMGWTLANALMISSVAYATKTDLRTRPWVGPCYIVAIPLTASAILWSTANGRCYQPHVNIWAFSFVVVGMGYLWPYRGQRMDRRHQVPEL